MGGLVVVWVAMAVIVLIIEPMNIVLQSLFQIQ